MNIWCLLAPTGLFSLSNRGWVVWQSLSSTIALPFLWTVNPTSDSLASTCHICNRFYLMIRRKSPHQRLRGLLDILLKSKRRHQTVVTVSPFSTSYHKVKSWQWHLSDLGMLIWSIQIKHGNLQPLSIGFIGNSLHVNTPKPAQTQL